MSYQQITLRSNEASWGFAFANRFSKILEERKIKPVELSRRTGVPESTIKAAMEGRVPNYYRMMLLAQGLDMTIEKLTDIRPFADLDDLEDDEDFEE